VDLDQTVYWIYRGICVEEKQFKKLVSDVQSWIASMLAEYKAQMAPVEAARFESLNGYFPQDLLQRVQRVIVDRCPVPPLAVTGIPQLAEIESWDIKGIPWENTIFIRRDLADWDAVHFHELLHVVQWDYLGAEGYLTAWAIGTVTRGYRDNPLEEMAFRHQTRFERGNSRYDVVGEVVAEIDSWPRSHMDIRRIKAVSTQIFG
jgi:hypothetical protein